MAYGLQPTHEYVKFVRGTKVAFDALLNKPDDTLFFIYENIEDNKGTLYLGDKKIGDGGAESLSDLITETVQDGELLVYTQPEGQEGHWEPLPIEDIIGNMTGATASNAGLSGLVPAPAAGDENKFLRGDGTWAAVEGGTFSIDENQFELNSSNKLSLAGFTEAAVGTIPQKSSNNKIVWTSPVTETRVTELINNATSLGLRRTIVGNLSEVTDESYIYMIPKESGSTGNLFDEFILVNGQVEKIGDGSSQLDLTGYVTKAEFETEVNSLQSLLNNCVTSDTLTNYVTVTQFNTQVGDLNSLNRVSGNSESTIVDEINSINERLTWQAIVEEK